jgi:subtilisin family serine protease
VAVGAPGVAVVTDAPDYGYYEVDGTSPACAYVAGVVALVKARYPRLSPAQIKLLLEDTASHRPSGGRDDYVGFGIVDPVAALRAAASLVPGAVEPNAAAYHGARYFGFGPTVAIYPTSAWLSDGLRWLLDGVLAFVCCMAAGVLVIIRGSRRARAWPPPTDHTDPEP